MKNEKHGLSAFSLTMLALGTVVGGSFFLGSSIAIKAAGPAVVISYLLGGVLVYFTLFALSEMTVADSSPGSFRTFSEKAFGPGVGFVVGWVYWTGLVLAMSSEAIAASLLLRTWFPQISVPLLASAIIVLTFLVNLLGAERLSKLESGLAAVKLLAIAGFIALGLALIAGFLPNRPAIGLGVLQNEVLFPQGIRGIAGSMLIVMFTYAGFEIIGLAASEAKDPHKTIPRAITYTVLSLVGLYTIAIGVLLPLIPTGDLKVESSPMVEALSLRGIGWAAGAINIILITAILSTMLAATFGLGRMIRSLADEGHAPLFMKDTGDIPYKGIIFSSMAMLSGMLLGFVLPKHVYIFLVSSGGFALLFTYTVILATHYNFRRRNGCPPVGKCQFPGFPYTSWLAQGMMISIIISMPLVSGQEAGLKAGLVLVAFYSVCYALIKHYKYKRSSKRVLS